MNDIEFLAIYAIIFCFNQFRSNLRHTDIYDGVRWSKWKPVCFRFNRGKMHAYIRLLVSLMEWPSSFVYCLFLPISKIWVCVRMRKREREFAAEWDSEKTGFTHKLSVKVPLPLITQFSLWKLLIFKRTEIRTK